MNERLALVLLAILACGAVGCTHSLEVVNLDAYTVGRPTGQADLKLAIVSGMDTGPEGYRWLHPVVDALRAHRAVSELTIGKAGPASGAAYEVDIAIARPKYSTSKWNFLITWPGFLIFTPGWNGLIYDAEIDASIKIRDLGPARRQLISETVHVEFDIRHTSADRGLMAGTGWVAWTIPAFIGGIHFSARFDESSLGHLHRAADRAYGEYLADQIIRMIRANKIASAGG